jgi:hypothetical protein
MSLHDDMSGNQEVIRRNAAGQYHLNFITPLVECEVTVTYPAWDIVPFHGTLHIPKFAPIVPDAAIVASHKLEVVPITDRVMPVKDGFDYQRDDTFPFEAPDLRFYIKDANKRNRDLGIKLATYTMPGVEKPTIVLLLETTPARSTGVAAFDQISELTSLTLEWPEWNAICHWVQHTYEQGISQRTHSKHWNTSQMCHIFYVLSTYLENQTSTVRAMQTLSQLYRWAFLGVSCFRSPRHADEARNWYELYLGDVMRKAGTCPSEEKDGLTIVSTVPVHRPENGTPEHQKDSDVLGDREENGVSEVQE